MLPPLRAAGAHIINIQSGEPVRLRGVNRSGLEYADPKLERRDDASGHRADGDGGERNAFLNAACITRAEIEEIVCGWGANIIRLPFTQEFVLRGRGGRPAAEYLDALDRVIAWAAECGAYTLLDLQWLDGERVFGTNGDFTFNRVPPLPEAETIDAWALLAARYRDEPAVLFDLFNEPHDPLPDDSTELLAIDADGRIVPREGRGVRMEHWRPWARHLIDTIRAEHPASLIFVSGVRWAYDLRGLPDLNRENIVYSTHVYPWTRTHPLRFAGGAARDWHRAFGHLVGTAPLFAGEWGGTDDHIAWGAQLLDYFEQHGIGWTAWSWADWPHLVHGCRAADYTPTAFGALVRRGLMANRQG